MPRLVHPHASAFTLAFAVSVSAMAAQPPSASQPDPVKDYLAGRAAPADYPAIAQECRSRALAGKTDGQTCLGYMYAHGNGVTEDSSQAIDWWRKAALQEDVLAQNALGSTYEFGHGVPVDCAEAAKWYGMSADQGSPWGMYYLAVMAAEGRCMPIDDVRALAWLDLALPRFPATASKYVEWTNKLQAVVTERMSADQFAQAKRMEQDFRPATHIPASGVVVLASFPATNPLVACSAERDQVMSYYPAMAQRAGVGGHTRVACKVSVSGVPSACTWTEEYPSGYGFGSSAAKDACHLKFDRPASVPASDWIATAPLRFAAPIP